MELDVVQLTQDLVAIPSASQHSNEEIAGYLESLLGRAGFAVERLAFQDAGGAKVSLVARKGSGAGGLGFFSHSDTVPGDGAHWDPFSPQVVDGHLIGRGSCDMKGPLAATIVAGSLVKERDLHKPLTIIVTADEEVGYGGAHQVVKESRLYNDQGPDVGVIAEPTRLIPVYAHKGGARIVVTAHGRSAHTSTDSGISANFLIAPFLAEMAELLPLFRSDRSFMNQEFHPPTNGFNMVLDDGACAVNVTAAKTVCTLGLRIMPDARHEDAVALILERARRHDLEVEVTENPPFYTDQDSDIVEAALAATGLAKAETVPFGTEAAVFHPTTHLVVLGPGDIAQAHTVGEWIDVAQLRQAVDVYSRLIDRFCR